MDLSHLNQITIGNKMKEDYKRLWPMKTACWPTFRNIKTTLSRIWKGDINKNYHKLRESRSWMFQRFVIHSLTKRCSNKKRFPFIDQVLPSVTNDFLFHFLSSFFFIIVFFFKFQPLISFFEEEVKSLVTACWILVLELCTCQLMSPID